MSVWGSRRRCGKVGIVFCEGIGGVMSESFTASFLLVVIVFYQDVFDHSCDPTSIFITQYRQRQRQNVLPSRHNPTNTSQLRITDTTRDSFPSFLAWKYDSKQSESRI